MLLNRLSVLDKGYVALISSSNSGIRLKELSDEFFKADTPPEFTQIASATIIFKCPLFVQLQLSKLGFTIVQVPPKQDALEAYNPDFTDIGTPVKEDNLAIADDLYRTSQALLINPKAYQHDGCNRFISQVNTPISVYTELLISGSLNTWFAYLNQENLPSPLEVYRVAVESILRAEWKNLDDLRKLK